MPRLIMICVGLTGIFFAAGAVALAGSRQAYHDPFAPYEAIMPGQPSEMLKAYPCNIYRDDVATQHCTFSLKEGPFDSVHVIFDHDAIKWIGFNVRQGSLHLSDLVLCWGKPASVKQNFPDDFTEWAEVHWSKQGYVVIAADWRDAHPGYHLPIYYISKTDKWQPCRSS